MAEIRRCRERDLPAVMDFIHEHWAKDHILARNLPLMKWQHADDDDPGLYNWMIALDEEGIQGILGFIPTSKYDRSLAIKPFTWLALWKVRTEAKNRTLGLQLMNSLTQSESAGVVAVLGINPKHPPMYKALGYRTGELAQYFVTNPDKPRTLISAPPDFDAPVPRKGMAVLSRIDAAGLERLALDPGAPAFPLKTPRYFEKRYLDHPIYTYQIYVAQLEGRPLALIAVRIAGSGPAKALRIVDFLGNEDALAECGAAFGHLLTALDCEYADFWQYGLSENTMEACGFRRAPVDGDVTVPNYFEPLLRKNARIEFAIRCEPDRRLTFFRGDGDQDRPNRAPSPEIPA
ncbi:MAG: hypothetical protein M3Y08_14005 [Fibrobacterota bacterium]|nr:hypothetical protein [Fibrobacterota bacterium]